MTATALAIRTTDFASNRLLDKKTSLLLRLNREKTRREAIRLS